MRKPISMFLFLAATAAFAVEPSILPQEPPPAKSDGTGKTEHDRLDSVPYTEPDWDLLSLRACGGLGYQGYQVGGDGFSGSLSNARGWIYGLEVRYRPALWYTFALGYRRQTTPVNYSGTGKFNPSDFDVVQDQINAGVLLSPFSYFEGTQSTLSDLSIAFGASTRKRDAVVTIPNALITSVRQAGLYIGPVYETSLGKKFNLEASLIGYFPFVHYETEKFTGYNMTSYTGLASVAVGYPIIEHLEIALRLFLEIEKTSYTSSSVRGTINGNETLTNFGAPLELRAFF